MSNFRVEQYLKGHLRHRPTWKVGANACSHGTPQASQPLT